MSAAPLPQHHYNALLPPVCAHAAPAEGAAILAGVVSELTAVSAELKASPASGFDYARVRRQLKLLVRFYPVPPF